VVKIANFAKPENVISAYNSQQLVTSESANNLVGEFSNSSQSSFLSFAIQHLQIKTLTYLTTFSTLYTDDFQFINQKKKKN
jgi:hypothetical protein